MLRLDGAQRLSDDAGSGLRRRISFPLLVLYGLGTTVGAGVYALVGEVAGLAGSWAPWAFLLAAVLAITTAMAFAELSSRHPTAAGEAAYIRAAFGSRGASLAIGLAVVASGTVSAATVTNGFAGYVTTMVPGSDELIETLLVAGLAAVAAWGIKESLTLAAIVTVLEVGGLLAVVTAVGAGDPGALMRGWVPVEPLPLAGLVGGATLAFYAFLGFEDMVNVAEEVEDAPRTVPRAILWTLAITAFLYGIVAVAAVASVSAEDLAKSSAPLALVYERAVGRSPIELVVIGSLAMVNGALIQIIMASRVVYGLSRAQLVPEVLGRVYAGTGTPLVATGLVAGTVWLLALTFPLASLARVTALLALAIFGSIHAALFTLQRRAGPAPAFRCPAWIPVVGAVTSALLITVELLRLANEL